MSVPSLGWLSAEWLQTARRENSEKLNIVRALLLKTEIKKKRGR